MKGQIGLAEYMESLKADTLRARYPIPKLAKKYLDEERWVDDWHYCDEELPPEEGVYYCIHTHGECYIYGYLAYACGQWWKHIDTPEKWLLIHGPTDWMRPFAWVDLPLEYEKDKTYEEMFLSFHIIRDRWEREQRIVPLQSQNLKE